MRPEIEPSMKSEIDSNWNAEPKERRSPFVQTRSIAVTPDHHGVRRQTIHAVKSAKTEPCKLERRRQSNRQSARRWRNRKRSKLSDLHDQIGALRNQYAQLEQENSKLKETLAVEIVLAKADSASRLQDQERSRSSISWLPLNAHLQPKSNWTAEKYPSISFTQAVAYPPLSRMTSRASMTIPCIGGYEAEIRAMALSLDSDPIPSTPVSDMGPNAATGLFRYNLSEFLQPALFSTSAAVRSSELPHY